MSGKIAQSTFDINQSENIHKAIEAESLFIYLTIVNVLKSKERRDELIKTINNYNFDNIFLISDTKSFKHF